MSRLVVVGHGVVGAVACWRAAEAGLDVTCLDPAPAQGATHAAAGMLAPVTETEFGESEMLRLTLDSAARWPHFAQQVRAASGIDVGYRRCGVLSVGYERADVEQLGRLAALQREHGLRVTELGSEEARRRRAMLGPRVAGGFWNDEDGQVDPRLLMRALAVIAERRGVRLVRRSAVSLLRTAAGGVRGVMDDHGQEHPADVVVLATGHAVGPLLERTAVLAPVRPVKGEVLRLVGTGPEWPREPCIVRGLVQHRPVYAVFRGTESPGDGEVVLGATSTEWPDDRRVTAGGLFGLLRDVRALIPGIDELAVAEHLARARPATPDNLPLLGATSVPGLVLATGHYRHGILLAASTAHALDAILADRPVDDIWQAAHPERFAAASAPTRGAHA
ncbi:glycine oxidase ThiO [Aeromicrobium sp. CF4.19]|uniref:glycine oxidase ThiO n=1 Tax=Aeromicrobium sp. CF4.19 TaxID=3373082 RepID=UPI003EE71BBC